MRQPDVSVLMTVFNTARYLEEAIRSVLAQQTRQTFELLIVDDGSSDESLAIAEGWAQRHGDCIRVLQHAGGANCGISASRNLAMRHARAPLLGFLDSDDVWLPHHLEVQTGILEEHPEISMTYASAERWVDFQKPFNEAEALSAWWGTNYIPPLVPAGEEAGRLRDGALLQWFLRDESMVPCIGTVVVRAAHARAVGGFRNEFRGLYDDQAFHAKLALHYSIYANDICTGRYRQHRDSCCAVSATHSEVRQQERARFLNFLAQYRESVASRESYGAAVT